MLLLLLFAQSALPTLTYSHARSTTIELRNLGEHDVDVQVEPHRESGSLVALVEQASVNPWFEGEVGEMAGARLAVVNTSDVSAVVTGCYSGGTLVSNPNVPSGAGLRPLCTRQFLEQLPPFSARQYPVVRDGNSHFSLHASGRGIALQMLRLLDAGTQLFQVDSSISFGK